MNKARTSAAGDPSFYNTKAKGDTEGDAEARHLLLRDLSRHTKGLDCDEEME